VALVPDRLVDDAVAATGLSEFGDGAWRDGLEVFCDSLMNEARLNDLGWAVHQARLDAMLRQRLAVVDWCRRHPDIDEQVIARPLIQIGLPRTGTTALAHLLAADPDTRSLRTWEASTPTPPPELATMSSDPRVAATQAGIDMSHQLMPDLPRMYFATATSPTETLDLTGMSARAMQWGGQARVPSYEDWLLAADLMPAYVFQRRVQQLLQWRCPPTRWSWKNPPDLFALDAVRAVFPDAVFVWTHRAPHSVVASTASLVTVVRALGTDEVDRAEIGRRQLTLWSEAASRAIRARDRIGDAAFVDIWMDDLAGDPITAIAGLYEAVGWAFTPVAEEAMRAWFAGNPRHGRGAHTPDASEFGLDRDEIDERFAAYRERFGRDGW
jgi:hypothetical protein